MQCIIQNTCEKSMLKNPLYWYNTFFTQVHLRVKTCQIHRMPEYLCISMWQCGFINIWLFQLCCVSVIGCVFFSWPNTSKGVRKCVSFLQSPRALHFLMFVLLRSADTGHRNETGENSMYLYIISECWIRINICCCWISAVL